MTDEEHKEIELANTVEAYTFLARHLLVTFPGRFKHARQRTILRHAIEHITGEKMAHPIAAFFRSIFG